MFVFLQKRVLKLYKNNKNQDFKSTSCHSQINFTSIFVVLVYIMQLCNRSFYLDYILV